LLDLYFRPSVFFRGLPRDDAASTTFAAVYVVGIVTAIGRIDRMLLQDRGGFVDEVTASWPLFWFTALAGGALSALFAWYVGGWWYGLRLRWSGIVDATTLDARLLFTYSQFVAALPSLGYTVAAALVFENYALAWASEGIWSAALVVFPFWGIAISYRGLSTWYGPPRRWAARFWFVILPTAFYIVAIGVFAALFEPSIGEDDPVGAGDLALVAGDQSR
jgi:hypothetical protein